MKIDQNLLDMVVSLEALNDNQLLAGLAVVSKDIDIYLSQHPRKDAEMFLLCYAEALNLKRAVESIKQVPADNPAAAIGVP